VSLHGQLRKVIESVLEFYKQTGGDVRALLNSICHNCGKIGHNAYQCRTFYPDGKDQREIQKDVSVPVESKSKEGKEI